MIDGNAFNGTETVGSSVHPATVVGLHLEGVDEGVDDVVLLEVVSESVVAELTDHVHHRGLHRNRILNRSGSSLDIGQDLRIVGFICNPTDLGTLHGVVESDTKQVIPPGGAVVGQRLIKRPLTDLFDRHFSKSEESAEVVVGHHRFGGDGCAATDQFVMLGVVVGTVEVPPRGDIDVVTRVGRRGHVVVTIMTFVVIHRGHRRSLFHRRSNRSLFHRRSCIADRSITVDVILEEGFFCRYRRGRGPLFSDKQAIVVEDPGIHVSTASVQNTKTPLRIPSRCQDCGITSG